MGLKICSVMCDQCLFSPGKIVSNERKRDLIEQCIATGRYFVCHKFGTKDDEGRENGEAVCCRGWYETYGGYSQLIRIAERLKVIETVDPPDKCFLETMEAKGNACDC